MAISASAATQILNNLVGKVAGQGGSTPGGIVPNAYLALSLTVPNSDGTNFTEPGGGYARTFLGNAQSGTNHLITVNGATASNADKIIFFNEAIADWTPAENDYIKYWGIFSAATGGTPVLWGALTSNVKVPQGYVPIFRAGNFVLSVQ